MIAFKNILLSLCVGFCAFLVTGCHSASPIGPKPAYPTSSLALSINGRLYIMENEDSANLKPVLTVDSGLVIRPYMTPKLSPDRKLVAFYATKSGGSGFSLCVIGVDGHNLKIVDIVTLPGQFYQDGVHWSPDSKTMVFDSPKAGENNIFVVNLDGAEQQITNDQFDIRPRWSPDGRYLAFIRNLQVGPSLVIYDYSNSMVLATIPHSYWYYWSPKDNELVYGALPDSLRQNFNEHLYVTRVEGTGVSQPVDLTKDVNPPPWTALWGGWNPSGDRILAKSFSDTVSYGQTAQIVSIDPQTGGSQVLTTLSNIYNATWSQDGKIYYTEWGSDPADFLADVDLYIMNADGSGQKLLLRGIQDLDW